ncbi:MAG: AAA family ATPase [Gammaproteobacteria bacterium]|nr:AAA family ATPase [Gammaproteobacteria bacterium]
MYTDFYNFKAKPFALTPDLRFLFKSDGHKRALAYLHYGLEQAEGFVIITGHIGAGKTLLIQALLEDLKTQEIATARIAAANLDKEEIIPMVAASLKQPFEGKSKTALIRDLELSLRRARDYLKGVLLIVDEAQTLTPEALEELRILSNLESNGKALIQVFLIGQSDFRDTVQLPIMEPLRQRTVASYHLEPLTRAELKRYIGFRLLAVGWEGNPKIDNEVYNIAHQFTGGIPRKINIFMDRFLVYGFLEEITEFTSEHAVAVVKELGGEIAGDFINAGESLPDKKMQGDKKSDGEEHPGKNVRAVAKGKKSRKGRNRSARKASKNKNNRAKKNGKSNNNPETSAGSSETPLEKRLRGLDRKLKKLGDQARFKT